MAKTHDERLEGDYVYRSLDALYRQSKGQGDKPNETRAVLMALSELNAEDGAMTGDFPYREEVGKDIDGMTAGLSTETSPSLYEGDSLPIKVNGLGLSVVLKREGDSLFAELTKDEVTPAIGTDVHPQPVVSQVVLLIDGDRKLANVTKEGDQYLVKIDRATTRKAEGKDPVKELDGRAVEVMLPDAPVPGAIRIAKDGKIVVDVEANDLPVAKVVLGDEFIVQIEGEGRLFTATMEEGEDVVLFSEIETNRESRSVPTAHDQTVADKETQDPNLGAAPTSEPSSAGASDTENPAAETVHPDQNGNGAPNPGAANKDDAPTPTQDSAKVPDVAPTAPGGKPNGKGKPSASRGETSL